MRTYIYMLIIMLGVAHGENLGYFEASVMGVVQGITEFLPVSSTGHMIITNHLMGLNKGVLKPAMDAYMVMIQGGTILAVVLLYRSRISLIIKGLFGKNSEGLRLFRNILAAFLPAAFVGLTIGEWLRSSLFTPEKVIIALAVGGVLMLFVGKRDNRGKGIEDMTMKQSLIIGSMQCLAMWPGMSRSMMTIVGGYAVGLRPVEAAEFSFLLGLITLGAASSYSIVREGSQMLEVLSLGPVLVGGIIAFATGALAIRWLVNYLTQHGLGLFGWYRLGLAGVALLVLNLI